MYKDTPEQYRPTGPGYPGEPPYSTAARHHGPDARVTYAPGEVVAYQRKSNDDNRAAASIADQVDCNFETAADWGLPLDADGILSERPGTSGAAWWEGGGGPGIEGYSGPKASTRPVLTQIMKGIVAGKIRCIIVWSLDRLWRDVGICEAMMTVLSNCGCAIYDRNGPVNISTPDGKNAVRSTAIAAQNMREMATVNSPRGIRKSRGKGKLVVSGNRLGFRSVGGASGQVRHIPEEQEMAREIFRRYDTGMSVDEICRWLTDMGYQWLADVRKANKPAGTPTTAAHRQSIRYLLRDVRYQGRQLHEGQEWPCGVFLVDGEPVVPVALFERVQAKLKSRSRGAPSHSKTHPLSSIMRCGHCGQSMRSSRTTQTLKSGKVLLWYTWKSLHYCVECWCTHDLPVIYVPDVDDYVNTILGPLLLAELEDRACTSGQSALASERAAVVRDLRAAEHRLTEELPEEWERGKITGEMLANLERKIRERVATLKERLRSLDSRLMDAARLTVSTQSIADVDPAQRRDAIRAVLRWVAVIATDVPRVRTGETGYKWQTQPDAGRVVFCTTWGTLHTAFIERKKTDDHRTRLCFLRPAKADEVLGTVADFPDPDSFVAGLARAFKNKRYWHAPEGVAPGYTPGHEPPVAEFSVEE